MGNFGNGLWLVESDDDDNDDWIGDHNGDPEDLDESKFNEGEDSWTVIFTLLEDIPTHTPDYDDLPGWTVVDVSLEEGHQIIRVTGTFQGDSFDDTQQKENDLQEFFRNHSDQGDNSFYVVKRWEADLYKKFPDADRDMLKYMIARFQRPPRSYISKKVLYFSFILRSMWEG